MIDPVVQTSTIFNIAKYLPKQNLFKRWRETVANTTAAGQRVIVLDPLFFTSLKVVKGSQQVNIFTTNDIPPDGDMANAIYGAAIDKSSADFFDGNDDGIVGIKVVWPAQLTADISIICTELARR